MHAGPTSGQPRSGGSPPGPPATPRSSWSLDEPQLLAGRGPFPHVPAGGQLAYPARRRRGKQSIDVNVVAGGYRKCDVSRRMTRSWDGGSLRGCGRRCPDRPPVVATPGSYMVVPSGRVRGGDVAGTTAARRTRQRVPPVGEAAVSRRFGRGSPPCLRTPGAFGGSIIGCVPEGAGRGPWSRTRDGPGEHRPPVRRAAGAGARIRTPAITQVARVRRVGR
jgi:hypothetical protein